MADKLRCMTPHLDDLHLNAVVLFIKALFKIIVAIMNDMKTTHSDPFYRADRKTSWEGTARKGAKKNLFLSVVEQLHDVNRARRMTGHPLHWFILTVNMNEGTCPMSAGGKKASNMYEQDKEESS